MAIEYHSIKTRSGFVGYATLGSGKPLIMLVGYSGTLFHWNTFFIEKLAEHFTLYLLDNRFIGLSNSSNEHSIKGMAFDVIDFIDAKNLVTPFILGWSMGGTIAQEIAKYALNKISGLILLASVPNNSFVNIDFLYFMRNSKNFTKEEFKEKLYLFFFSKPVNSENKDFLIMHALKFSNYQFRFSDVARNFQDIAIMHWQGSSALELQKINVPTLLLWSIDDMVVNNQAQQFFMHHLPCTKLIEYQVGGHFLIATNPGDVAKDIIDYFT